MEYDKAAPGLDRIVGTGAELEIVANDVSFGEGPVWNKRTGELFYVSIVGDAIWKYKPGVGRQIVMQPSYKADGMTFDREGRLVVAGWARRNVWRMEHDGSIKTLCAELRRAEVQHARTTSCANPTARSISPTRRAALVQRRACSAKTCSATWITTACSASGPTAETTLVVERLHLSERARLFARRKNPLRQRQRGST